MRDSLMDEELEGYEPEIGSALWRLQETRERTLRTLADVQGDEIDDGRSGNSVGTILYHLALIEADWLFSEILEEPVPEDLARLFPSEDRDEAGILAVVRGESLESHLSRLMTIRQTLLERMHGMTVAEFHRPRALPNYDVTPVWVLHHLAQHEAEHRGELGLRLELLRSRPGGERG